MTPKLLILNKVYNPIDVEFTFTLAEKFENTSWDLNNNGYLDVEGSGLLATLTDEMNALNAAYLQSIGEPKAKTVYLFLLPNAPQNRDGISIAGDMPRDKRFGYLFPTSSAEILGSTIAHELGHGLFNLKHIFDRDYGINQNTTDNLMDYTYTGGTKLIFYQWNQIHDPGHVWGLFEQDGDGQLAWWGGITWLGDWFGGLAFDPQEKDVENMQQLLDHVHEKYADYFEQSKANDIAITKTEHTDWSVRKFSHQNKVSKSIYSKLTKAESPNFNLWEKGIFVEKYKLEDKEYSVAVYSFANAITLQNSNIKLTGYKDLADSTFVKAGYTKNYGIITFYDDSKKPVLLLQIIGDKPEEDAKQWLNYLAIVTESDEQKKRDESIWDKMKTSNLMVYALEKLSAIWGEATVEKRYLPWMNYAIIEAQIMDGITECEEPLYSKGTEYHRNGGHNSFCPCGDKKSGHYCDPNAWCASFANWCLRQSNTAYTKSAGSQTFLNHAEFVKITEPIFGAIAVFTNLDGNGNFKTSGHVAFVVGKIGDDQILLLGGNQGQTIKVSPYSLSQDKKNMQNQLFFRGYYIPKAYQDKLKNYKTTITDYTDAKIANQQIINLNINSKENESTR